MPTNFISTFFQLHLFLLNAFSSSNLIKFNKRNILSSRTSNRHLFLSSSLATRVTFQPRGLNPYHFLPTPFDIEVNVSVNPGHPRVGGDTHPRNHGRNPPSSESYHRIYPLVFSGDLIRHWWTVSGAGIEIQFMFLLAFALFQLWKGEGIR
ncbi:hypothetical protein TNIN_185011 [Trichonephila inaurata madagascariensis]|uniref:Uncharacterized protein n=1 Tax=Trichonephila inaurata madagascariensis TaxID=2747483 RepID=A0A8X6M4X1_9ARAC|nr:hypothetical protein TNIN_185011 [Trichonephila inaurata madagascariensis]